MQAILVIDKDAFYFDSFEKFLQAEKAYKETKSLESITGYTFKGKVKEIQTCAKCYPRKNYKIKIPNEQEVCKNVNKYKYGES